MAEPDSLTPVDDEVCVFRLVPNDDVRYFDAGSRMPHPKAFELSSADKSQSPPRLSVFDVNRTTVRQAVRIRGSKIAAISAFTMLASDVRGISKRLDVANDPLPEDAGAGGEGHCGILGLLRRRGERKEVLEEIRWMLRDICAPHESA